MKHHHQLCLKVVSEQFCTMNRKKAGEEGLSQGYEYDFSLQCKKRSEQTVGDEVLREEQSNEAAANSFKCLGLGELMTVRSNVSVLFFKSMLYQYRE